MWKSGLLGEQHPCQLLDTLIYLLGIHCALRGGRNTDSCEDLVITPSSEWVQMVME